MSIIKNDSTSFEDQFKDVVTYFSIAGDIELNDFFLETTASRIASAIAAVSRQLRKQTDTNRREGFIKSALRAESIEYAAISQSNYSPKRNVAPQHSEGHEISCKVTDSFTVANLDKIVFAETIIDGVAYPVSIIRDFNLVSQVGPPSHLLITGKAAIGQWKKFIIQINEDEGHLETFHTFHIDEDRYVIDDSGTIEISVVTNNAVLQNGELIGGIYYRQVPVDNINRITGLSAEDTDKAVVVTTNFHGGVDINFGDGDIFGNGILDVRGDDFFDSDFGSEDAENAAYLVIDYFDTPGFVANLNFQKVTYDSNILIEAPIIDPIITNGLDHESPDSIKTLAPANNLAQYKIITPEDMSTDFQSIVTVKSAFAIKDVDVTNWNAGQIYNFGDIVVYLQEYYVFQFESIPDPVTLNIAPSLVPTYWIQTNHPIRRNNATLILHALVAADTNSWFSTQTYSIDDIVFHNDEYWKSLQDSNTIEPSSLPAVLDITWERSEPVRWEPLTQGAWEFEYRTQFNYPNRLGFLQVKVGTIVSIVQNYIMTVVIDPTIKLTESSQATINTEIFKIIGKYWEVLGVAFDIGEVIASINLMEEISKVYMVTPVSNTTLNPREYFIEGDVQITYKSFSDSSDRLCS